MYLGLDCGTSGLKALLIDESGQPVASAARSYSPERPRAGWSEQNPDDWLAAMAGAIAEIKDAASKAVGALGAVGFSGQMHGAVLLDRAVKPMPGCTGPKLKWIARNEPHHRRLINSLLSPKDYLRLSLTGERGSDMSDAAGTWLLDEARRAWSPEAFAACEADPAWAPPLFEGSAPVGRIRPEAADALG